MKPMFRSISAALVVIVALGAVASASASAHEWLKNGEPLTKTEAISLTGGEFTIYWASGRSDEVVCKKMGGTGELSPGAKGVISPHLSECVLEPGADKCIHSPGEPNGTITMSKVPTELVIAETSDGRKVLADQLKESTLTKRVVTVDLIAEETGGTCSKFVTGEIGVKGYTFGEVSGEQIEFPELEFSGDTLEVGGSIAGFEGKFTQKLTGGGTLTAI